MQDIESLAIENYQKNLEYFAASQPELSNLLAIFNQALENGDHQEQYALEYVKSYFDVKNLKSEQFLYAKDSNLISQDFLKLLNFKKDSYVFEGFPIYNYSQEDVKNSDDKTKGLEGIFPIMRYYLENSNRDDLMKKIEKYIFIGVGLGLHIPMINEKIKAKSYLIIEDDLELFRLSLFTTQYYNLAEHSTLYFSVADDENLFYDLMDKFLLDTYLQNRYLKYSYFPAHSDNKIKQIQNILSSSSFSTFPYKTSLRKFLKPLEYLNDGYNVLNISTHFKESIFSQKPMLLVTAGPSFQKHIEFLKNNHQKFIVVAVTATLNTLYKENIKPDIVVHIDGFKTSMIHINSDEMKEFLKETIVILGPFVQTELREMFSKEQIFYYGESTHYFENFGSLVSPCVGSFSLLLSLIFNVKELYLLGLDLALNQETGSTHSDEHKYNETKDMSDVHKLSNKMGLRQNIFPIQGNFEESVFTTPLFYISVQALYRSIPILLKETQTIYNLNHGAKLNKTLPLHIDKINLNNYSDINKKSLYNSIKDVFLENSANHLSESDELSMKGRLTSALVIKECIEKYHNSVSHSNSDKYMYDLLGVISEILHYQSREYNNLVYVYDFFFRYVLPILTDLFNTKNLKNEKRHIKKLDKLIYEEMLNIETIYEEALQTFIKEKL